MCLGLKRLMSTVPPGLEEKIADVLLRIERLETSQAETTTSPRWKFLVERSHSWRRQLCIKGRNMTAAQLVSAMNANRLSAEQAAVDFDLPLEAVQEALSYCGEQAELIAIEANEERRRLVEKGHRLGPSTLSG
jgi:uncharacterized protein (DUF433 family)